MDIINGSATSIKREIENPEAIDVHSLTNYKDKMKNLEGKLEGLKKEIVSLDDFERRLEKASHIERKMFDL